MIEQGEIAIYRCVQALPMSRVLSYFGEAEIDSIAESEGQVYGDEEVRWQLACDLACGDKFVSEEDAYAFLIGG